MHILQELLATRSVHIVVMDLQLKIETTTSGIKTVHRVFKGAWWYNDCVNSNLNGVYLHGKHSKSWEGMVWYTWKGANYSVKRAEIKIRRVKA